MELATRLLQFVRQALPRAGLLSYLARPNSDGYLTDETAEIPEDEVDWGFYTGEDVTIIAAIENALGAGNVLEGVALATEIAASNQHLQKGYAKLVTPDSDGNQGVNLAL